MAHGRRGGARVLRVRHPRPGRRRALVGRTVPPPGPGGAGRRGQGVPGRPGPATSPLPPKLHRRRRTTSWPTAMSSWRRSRAARTRRIPRCWSGAGLLAQKAVARGPPGQAVGEDLIRPRLAGRRGLPRAGRLVGPLEQLGFFLVGFGCTTCIGNSGPLLDGVSEAGQRGRPVGGVGPVGQPELRGAHPSRRSQSIYLASPPLVVAYALAGTMGLDLTTDPIGRMPMAIRCSCPSCGRRAAGERDDPWLAHLGNVPHPLRRRVRG